MNKFLLPHHFKFKGAVLFPAGIAVWICGQSGYFNHLLKQLQLKEAGLPFLLTISFFSFLFGLYFLVFSKEKKEDEFISKIRLESFQVAAITQLVFFIASFLYMLIFKKEPGGDAGLMLFLLAALFLFWLVYVIRFNFVIRKMTVKNEE